MFADAVDVVGVAAVELVFAGGGAVAVDCVCCSVSSLVFFFVADG